MRGRIRNDEDFGQAANAAVTRNTDDLAAMVGSLFGDQAATAFRSLWTDHVTALFNYSRGLATDDTAARDDAKAQLVDVRERPRRLLLLRLAGTAARATRPARPSDPRRAPHRAGRRVRGPGLRAVGRAVPRDLLAHLRPRPHARRHAAAARPGGGAGPAVVAAAVGAGPAARRARRAGRRRAAGRRDEQPGLPRGGGRLNGNTGDLTAAMGTLFGAQAGQQFMSLWADHIDELVGYTTGVAADDAAKPRRRAGASCATSRASLAAFLDSATGSKMPSADLAKAFLAHDEMLTQQVDAFADKDYPRAHELAYSTYQDMFGLVRPAGRGVRGHRGGPAPAGRRPDRRRRHGGPDRGSAGNAMRWAAAARAALVVARRRRCR